MKDIGYGLGWGLIYAAAQVLDVMPDVGWLSEVAAVVFLGLGVRLIIETVR